MTRDEIMNATSEQLNEWTVEKVMRWKEHVDFDYIDGLIARYVPGTMEVVNFQPSTDISAAWEVVEKMNEKYWAEITQGIYMSECRIGEYGENKITNSLCSAKTTPEAIVKAALLAVIEEVTA